jgi:GTP 3',8-cyclase
MSLLPVLPDSNFCVAAVSRNVPKMRLLRLSVTDRCNFRCRYCMPPEGVPKVPNSDLLSLERLAELVAWLTSRVGIERVKLTGGEPLVRAGINHLISQIASTPGVKEVSLTTNGSLLTQLSPQLKAAGLSRVNVSLDSLDPARFAEVTRGARLEQTLDGIQAAIAAGLVPLKLNAVLRRSTWQDDVPSLIDYAAQMGLELRFIELMRTGTERNWCESEFIAVHEVRAWLEKRAQVLPMATPTAAPARMTQVSWQGKNVAVGWIMPRSHPFCSSCERVRLDSRGRLHRCLMDQRTLDLATLLHQESSDFAAAALYGYMADKRAPDAMDSADSMSLIGG